MKTGSNVIEREQLECYLDEWRELRRKPPVHNLEYMLRRHEVPEPMRSQIREFRTLWQGVADELRRSPQK